MSVKMILMGLFRARSGRDGMWDFLGKRAAGRDKVERERVAGRNQVDLEEVRNKGTQEVMRLLRHSGGTVREGGPDWSREICLPDPPPHQTAIRVIAIQPAIGPTDAPSIEPPTGQHGGPAGESSA
jgi:hypothetical protein